MESKNKKFTKKLVSFLLAVLMAFSAFSAGFSAFAANNNREYVDDKLASNILAWADVTDEQALEALFDYVDYILPGANINLDVEQPIIGSTKISIHAKLRSVNDIIELVGNQLYNNINPLSGVAGDVGSLNLKAMTDLHATGVKNANYACGMDYRSTNSAKRIIKCFAQLLIDNTNSTNSIVYKLLDGTFSLGMAQAFVKIYEKLQPMLGTQAGYEKNFFYEVTRSMMLSKTGWFTKEEQEAYKMNGPKGAEWNIDTVTRNKVNEMWLPQISAWVTYTVFDNKDFVPEEGKNKPHTESSAERRDKIDAYIKSHNLSKKDVYDTVQTDLKEWEVSYQTAAKALGYDPNLVYCTIDTLENNINIFEYGYGKNKEKLTIEADTTLYTFAAQAFKLAWKTVLKDTLELVHVDFKNWKNNRTNFDNEYFYYMRDNGLWDKSNWQSNYDAKKIEAWAEAASKQSYWANQGLDTKQKFLDAMKNEYTTMLDRRPKENPTYSWHDIEIEQFFNKLRYSPIADKYFKVQTGPLNLYLLQTGFTNTATFLDEYSKDTFVQKNQTVNGVAIPSRDPQRAGIMGVINNGLVAMCKDLFVEGENIGLTDANGVCTPIARPQLITTEEFTVMDDASKLKLVDAITKNFMMVIEYLLNVSDVNVLAKFYKEGYTNTAESKVPGVDVPADTKFDGSTYYLNEMNLEQAMLPLLIGAVNEVKINNNMLLKHIHDETWDRCTSAEAVAITVLEDHLAYVLPDRDYSELYKFNDKTGDMEATTDMNNDGKLTLLEDVILIMTRDAVGYQLAPILPLRHITPESIASGEDIEAQRKAGTLKYEQWSPYTMKDGVKEDKTSLYDILNCVIIYYCNGQRWWADANDNTQGQGMGDLLGTVDAQGKSLINEKNNLFENCNIIVNHLLPFFGILQTGKTADLGKFDSHHFLIDVLVDGCLDIGTVKDTATLFPGTTAENFGGIKTFLYQLITIMTCEPIMNMTVEKVLYEIVLCPLINNVFGARFDNNYPHVIPTLSELDAIYANTGIYKTKASDTPIDALFRKEVFVKYNGASGTNGIGVLGILLDSIYKAFGGADKADASAVQGIDGAWQAAGFIVQSIANLDPWFAPQLKPHRFGVLTADLKDPSFVGQTAGAKFTTEIRLKNNALGLNRFRKDVDNKNQIQENRYFMEVTNAEVLTLDGSPTPQGMVVKYDKTQFIEPQNTRTGTVEGTVPDAPNSIYKVCVTYNIWEGTKADPKGGSTTPIYSGQQAYTYLLLSTESDFDNQVYNTKGAKYALKEVHNDTIGNLKDPYVSQKLTNSVTTNGFGPSKGHDKIGSRNDIKPMPRCVASFAKTTIIPMSKPSVVDKYTFNVMNYAKGDWQGGDFSGQAGDSFAGVYAFVPAGFKFLKINNTDPANGYFEKDLYTTAGTNSKDTEGRIWAFASIDHLTGDILNVNRVDYFDPGKGEIDPETGLHKGEWFRGDRDTACGVYKGFKDINEIKGLNIMTTDPESGKQVEVTTAKGFSVRPHVVWTQAEYLSNVDWNKDANFSANEVDKQDRRNVVKGVNRTQIGFESDGETPVYRYENAIIDAADVYITNGEYAPSMATPINGINITTGSFTVKQATRDNYNYLKYDGETELKPAEYTFGIMIGKRGQTGGDVEVTFKVVDDTASKELRNKYETVSKEFLAYKDSEKVENSDFNLFDYNGKQVRPYQELQSTFGDALVESAKALNLDSVNNFASDRIDVANVVDSRTPVGPLAYEPLKVSDPVAPAFAINGYNDGAYWYADEAKTLPAYSNRPVTDVLSSTTEVIDGVTYNVTQDAVGSRLIQNPTDNTWHFKNEKKMIVDWCTTGIYENYPVRYETNVQVGTNTENKSPVYNEVQYEYYSIKSDAQVVAEGQSNWSNMVTAKHSIINPSVVEGTQKDNRNMAEKLNDKIDFWRKAALSVIKTAGGNKIHADVTENMKALFGGEESINYDMYTYNAMLQVAKDAESLLTVKYEDDLSQPVIDPLTGQQKLDHGKPVYEQKATYSTTASSLQVDNAIREYQKWAKYVKVLAPNSNKLDEALNWTMGKDQATKDNGSVNSLNDPITAQLSATRAAESITVSIPTARYGAIKDSALVNEKPDGSQAYTETSWNNYVSALADAIDYRNKPAKEKTRTGEFHATKDLMMAENELDPFVPTEPEKPAEITVSGTVMIADNPTAVTYTKGMVGIEVVIGGSYENGNIVGGTVVATTAADGKFTAKVPAGTTTIGFRGKTTVDRIVNLSGTQDVTDAIVPIIIADYNRNMAVDAADMNIFSSGLMKYDVNCDYNANGAVDAADMNLFAQFIGKISMKFKYPDITLA